MTRETFKLIMAIGVLLNSALYLLTVFVMGVLLGQSLIWRLAVASIGVTYLSYLAQLAGNIDDDRPVVRVSGYAAPWLVWLSVALGIAAGIPLLGFR